MHRFHGTSVRNALRQVERELGPGALVVGTRPVAGGFEVTALECPRRPPPPPGPSRAFAPLAERARAFGLPETVLRNVDAALRRDGLARAAPGSRVLARAAAEGLAALVPVAGLPPPPAVLALVGPTGVGKTTTAAKLAARAVVAGERIALVSLDVGRPGASEPLRSLAASHGAPFAIARDEAELVAILETREEGRRVLVDTAGRAPRERAALRAAEQALGVTGVRALLCLPAGARRADAEAFADAFAPVRPVSAIVTKWDETRAAGEVLGVLADRRLPITHVTFGQRVPDDIVEADARAIAACALGLDEDVVAELLA